jgi:hypothetical protein
MQPTVERHSRAERGNRGRLAAAADDLVMFPCCMPCPAILRFDLVSFTLGLFLLHCVDRQLKSEATIIGFKLQKTVMYVAASSSKPGAGCLY